MTVGWLAMTVGTRNDPNSCHCEERSDVAIHTHPVIARSAATWQSIPTPSLRGAQRRGNPYFRQCRTLDGLLRLRLAMTVGRLAMTVGTRNDPNSCHCEEQSDVAIHTPPLSLRGAKRRGNPYFKQCRTLDGLLRLRLAMTVGTRNDPNSCHCEEQSDVAIHISGSAGR